MKIYTVKVDEYGTKRWYFNDKLHCEHGPAVEYANGTKEWYLDDKPHRTGGPAVESADGTKFWFLNGVEYTEAEWRKQLKAKADWRKQINKLKARKTTCEDKLVEVDGVKYKLVKI